MTISAPITTWRSFFMQRHPHRARFAGKAKSNDSDLAASLQTFSHNNLNLSPQMALRASKSTLPWTLNNPLRKTQTSLPKNFQLECWARAHWSSKSLIMSSKQLLKIDLANLSGLTPSASTKTIEIVSHGTCCVGSDKVLILLVQHGCMKCSAECHQWPSLLDCNRLSRRTQQPFDRTARRSIYASAWQKTSLHKTQEGPAPLA